MCVSDSVSQPPLRLSRRRALCWRRLYFKVYQPLHHSMIHYIIKHHSGPQVALRTPSALLNICGYLTWDRLSVGLDLSSFRPAPDMPVSPSFLHTTKFQSNRSTKLSYSLIYSFSTYLFSWLICLQLQQTSPILQLFLLLSISTVLRNRTDSCKIFSGCLLLKHLLPNDLRLLRRLWTVYKGETPFESWTPCGLWDHITFLQTYSIPKDVCPLLMDISEVRTAVKLCLKTLTVPDCGGRTEGKTNSKVLRAYTLASGKSCGFAVPLVKSYIKLKKKKECTAGCVMKTAVFIAKI